MYTTAEVSDLTGLAKMSVLQYTKRYGIGTWSDRLQRWLFSDHDLKVIEDRRRK